MANLVARDGSEEMSGSEYSDSDSADSDKELQIAFASGLLKPGLNVEAAAPKEVINNIDGLRQKLDELKKDLPWVERMNLTSIPTHGKLKEQDQLLEEAEGEDAHDDFKREMAFYRQAQAAVLEGIPQLHKLGIPTRRPDDYFAQMAKSDVHMKKVRENLLSKQMSLERSEKARKMRQLRKYGKKVQQEVLLKRQKEKKEMLDAVKKYRKGQQDRLDFLDELPGGSKQAKGPQGKKQIHQPNKKRQMKNKKFGFGGQKKRSKHNTKNSASDISEFSVKKHGARPGKFKKAKPASKNRPGKARRQKAKNKKKK